MPNFHLTGSNILIWVYKQLYTSPPRFSRLLHTTFISPNSFSLQPCVHPDGFPCWNFWTRMRNSKMRLRPPCSPARQDLPAGSLRHVWCSFLQQPLRRWAVATSRAARNAPRHRRQRSEWSIILMVLIDLQTFLQIPAKLYDTDEKEMSINQYAVGGNVSAETASGLKSSFLRNIWAKINSPTVV